jgi:hypothetical protein
MQKESVSKDEAEMLPGKRRQLSLRVKRLYDNKTTIFIRLI